MKPVVTQRFEVHLPTGVIVKVLLAALFVWAVLRLWPEMVFLSISLVLAVALEPAVSRMTRYGFSRGVTVMLIALLLLGVIVLVVAYVIPPLVQQVVEIHSNLPAFRGRVERRIPADNSVLRLVTEQVFLLPSSPEVAVTFKQPLIWGRAAVSGVITTCLVLVTTLYLLLDGKRIYAWLLAYVPRAQREKMAMTVSEVSVVVYAYVRAQLVISLLFASFAALVLYALKVPGVLPLAVLAGAFDVIPLIGIIIATAPAALLALTVSPLTAALVIVLYLGYHLFEAYVLVPRIYGTQLRLSTLTVLLALLVGGTLQGILGAALILPVVAAYPIIERIWLRDYLAPEVLADHTALAEAAENGSDEAIATVLQGEKHPNEHVVAAPTPLPHSSRQ